jgi:hypothetical protein
MRNAVELRELQIFLTSPTAAPRPDRRAAADLPADHGFPAAVIASCGVPVSAGLLTSHLQPAARRRCYLGWVTNPWR